MRPGEVSSPVLTPAGYHILMVLGRRTPRDYLFAQKFELERTRLLETLRERATIEIYPPDGGADLRASN